jgi:hypothetical protein
MALTGAHVPGATPLTEEDIRGLRLANITTQGELNEAEAQNILRGQEWALRSRTRVLSDMLSDEASSLGYLVVQGDAGVDDAALDYANIAQAKALVVTTEEPDRKLSITLLAHSRNPEIRIAVTGANDSRGALLHNAGASEVVIKDDLIAGALVERLKNGSDVKSGG